MLMSWLLRIFIGHRFYHVTRCKVQKTFGLCCQETKRTLYCEVMVKRFLGCDRQWDGSTWLVPFTDWIKKAEKNLNIKSQHLNNKEFFWFLSRKVMLAEFPLVPLSQLFEDYRSSGQAESVGCVGWVLLDGRALVPPLRQMYLGVNFPQNGRGGEGIGCTP